MIADSAREGGRRALLALLVLALLIKVSAALAAHANNPLAQVPASDARYYLDRALGHLGVIDDPLASEPYHLPPLYPLLLAAVPGVGKGNTLGVLLLQAICGVAALAGVYALAVRRVSRPAALFATALVLFYGPITFFETRLLGDSLAFDLTVALLVAADAYAGRPSVLRALLLGGLVAALALLRPQALLLAPLLLIFCGRRAPAYLAAFLLVLAPFTLHNWRASGDLILVSDNGGVNLWLANGEHAPLSGTFSTSDEAFGDIAQQAAVARSIAEQDVGHALTAGEVSRHFTRRALADVAADPARFLHRVALRAGALLESYETGVESSPEVEATFIPPLTLLPLPFGLLAALAAAALVLGAAFRRAPWLPLLAVAAMVIVGTLLFYHYSRFRLPLVPLLALLAAGGWDGLAAHGVRPLRLLLAGLLAAGLIAFSWLPARHHAEALAIGWTSVGNARLSQAVERRMHGESAEAQALALQALENFDAALQAQPGFVRADILGARTALLAGRYEACATYLERASAILPDDPRLLLNRAFLLANDDPANPYHDEAAAQALVTRLRVQAADDAALQRALDELR